MKSFGETIREIRIEKKLPLKPVAGSLGIDVAILSKIERGQRKASRELVIKIGNYYQVDNNTLLISWISDQVVHEIQYESQPFEVLEVAEEKVLYARRKSLDKEQIIKRMIDFFRQDGRVSKAWIFGSFARGENKLFSDIDVMVSYSEKASGTLMDYADIRQKLEKILNFKVDLVEEGYVKTFAQDSVDTDKVLIYGKA